MGDSKHTMNICSAWFSITGSPAAKPGATDLISTLDILAGCTGDSHKYANLQDFWPGRAQTLLHEWTHTTYFTGSSKKTIEYAYSVQICLNLAAGSRKMPTNRERDTKGNPICPDKDNPQVPGYCNRDFSIDNADTFSNIAGGLYLSDKAQCNRAIPIGLTADPPPQPASRKRQASGSEFSFDPPFDGDGIDGGACSNPINNCCGECSAPTSTSSSIPSPTPSPSAPPPPPHTSPTTASSLCHRHMLLPSN